jgi:hypothetical protein
MYSDLRGSMSHMSFPKDREFPEALTDSSLISCSGLFLGLTGTFSMVSNVLSDPSITLCILGISKEVADGIAASYLPTENGIFPVQRWLLGVRNEELLSSVSKMMRQSAHMCLMFTCDLLVSGPALAQATTPRLLNCTNTSNQPKTVMWQRCVFSGHTFNVGRTSSANGLPQIDCPPFPVPASRMRSLIPGHDDGLERGKDYLWGLLSGS